MYCQISLGRELSLKTIVRVPHEDQGRSPRISTKKWPGGDEASRNSRNDHILRSLRTVTDDLDCFQILLHYWETLK